jgi:hypothetical protein
MVSINTIIDGLNVQNDNDIFIHGVSDPADWAEEAAENNCTPAEFTERMSLQITPIDGGATINLGRFARDERESWAAGIKDAADDADLEFSSEHGWASGYWLSNILVTVAM